MQKYVAERKGVQATFPRRVSYHPSCYNTKHLSLGRVLTEHTFNVATPQVHICISKESGSVLFIGYAPNLAGFLGLYYLPSFTLASSNQATHS